MAFDNGLIQSIDKIHTTEMGAARIRRNLNLTVSDVVLWCKNAIVNARLITCRGKNFYVYYNDAVITVNAKSFTVITAHKVKDGFNTEEFLWK